MWRDCQDYMVDGGSKESESLKDERKNSINTCTTTKRTNNKYMTYMYRNNTTSFK